MSTTIAAGLDALGTADPTGLVDGYHALTYVARGEWGNAGLTALGVFPILGDAFKLGKYGRAVGGVEDVYARFGPELLHQSDAIGNYGDELFGQVDTATVRMSGSPNVSAPQAAVSGAVPFPSTAVYRVGDAIRAGGKYDVGQYNLLRETAQKGLDAHHVGQKAVMRDLVPGYDPTIAPSILVPKVGHTIRGPQGIVSRSTSGFTSARQVIARDIGELRRVYPDIANEQLQRLIELNKSMYPVIRRRP
jgi:hypothetical protein